MRFAIGLVTGVILTLLVPIAVVAAGALNMGAIKGPGLLETIFASWAYERWIDTHAPEVVPTAPPTTEAWLAGYAHYAQACVHCHGAPGVEPSVFGQGLSPRAPDLAFSARELTEEQLYHVIHDGVRMTGMPAFGRVFGAQDIAVLVRFVRDIDHITPEQQRALMAVTAHDYTPAPAPPADAPAPVTPEPAPADPPPADADEPVPPASTEPAPGA